MYMHEAERRTTAAVIYCSAWQFGGRHRVGRSRLLMRAPCVLRMTSDNKPKEQITRPSRRFFLRQKAIPGALTYEY